MTWIMDFNFLKDFNKLSYVTKALLNYSNFYEDCKQRFLNNIINFKFLQDEAHYEEIDGIFTEDELNEVLPSWVSEGFVTGTPLWNIKLIQLDGNRSALVIKLHHIVGDGVSFMSLLEEFCDKGWSNLQTAPVKSFSFAHWAYAWYNFPWTALKAFRLARIRKGFRPKGNNSCKFSYDLLTKQYTVYELYF